MKVRTTLLCFIAILALSTATHLYSESNSETTDESSFANIHQVKTEHFDLDITIDFERQVFVGRQTLHMRTHAFDVNTVALDIRDITIFNITNGAGEVLNYEVDSPNPIIGQRLVIYIPTEWIEWETFQLVIDYETSTTASAVTWLNKEQTSGKKLPYMYTQCESIHARSIAPLQDTPAIKATYTLTFTTPIDIITRASGNRTHEYTDEKYRHTQFEMNIPVQSYLIAIAAGNLAEKQIGSRTWVISEPEDLEKAANEFDLLENFVTQAEAYLTPYEWGIYKILVLPPSFPFGGMENPLLTFASPAIVVGDKSSVNVAIHEICHSWFGNLITNVNWSNFWLNEGFTVFFERKVVAKISGIDEAKISAKLENQTMYFQMLDFGMDNNYTSLHPKPDGNHPDDSMSTIPYEKGFQFLTYLESLIGEENMQAFLQSYIRKFQKTSISHDDFSGHFESFVKSKFSSADAKEIISKIDWYTWIRGPGLPPVTVDLETEAYNSAIALSEGFITGEIDPSAGDIYRGFNVNLKGLFISHLIQNLDRLDADKVQKVDEITAVGQEINGELVFRWLQVAIRSGYHQAPFDVANTFLGSIGRMKFVTPVYASINSRDHQTAVDIFNGHKDFYHPIAKQAIEALLNKPVQVVSE